jgi:cytidylate kinase
MGLFVASCGVGHVLREWTMFSGDFILEGRWMLLTFVCSMVADLGLWLHATDLKRLAKINGRRTDPHVPA